VALDAPGADGARGVVVMLRTVVGRRQVAARTDRVARCLQLEAVGLVTVRTAYTGRVHLALDERTVDVDLVEDLPVRMVEPLV